MDDQNHKQQAERLRALWKSGRDKYASFFSVLNEVRQQIGDDALPTWCFDELRIGVSVIVEARRLLTAMDAEIVKADLAVAKKAERDQREAEAIARRQAREEAERQRAAAQRQRELEQVEHDRKVAEGKRLTAEEDDKRKKVNEREGTRKRRAANPKMRGPRANAEATRRRTLNKIEDANFSDLVERYKKAEAQCAHGTDEWIAGSLAKAAILLEMRIKSPADRDFGEALAASGIEISHQNRAALIGLAQLGQEKMREILATTNSRSYEAIWRDTRVLKAV